MANIWLCTHWETKGCDQYNNNSVVKSVQPYSSMKKAKDAIKESEYWTDKHGWIRTSETYAVSTCTNERWFEVEAIDFDHWIDNPVERV